MSLRSTALQGLINISHGLRVPTVLDTLRSGRSKILMYHGIPTQERFEGVANYYGYNIPLKQFEEQVLQQIACRHYLSDDIGTTSREESLFDQLLAGRLDGPEGLLARLWFEAEPAEAAERLAPTLVLVFYDESEQRFPLSTDVPELLLQTLETL